MKVRRFIYNLQVWLAHVFLSKNSKLFSTYLDVAEQELGFDIPGIEIDLCRHTPYYDKLFAKIKHAKDYIGVGDGIVGFYRLKLVSDWFKVPDPDGKQIIVMGAVHPSVVQVSLQGPGYSKENDWEWTLCHEFAHLYCREHPGLAPDGDYDYDHAVKSLWDRVNAYRYPQK